MLEPTVWIDKDQVLCFFSRPGVRLDNDIGDGGPLYAADIQIELRIEGIRVECPGGRVHVFDGKISWFSDGGGQESCDSLEEVLSHATRHAQSCDTPDLRTAVRSQTRLQRHPDVAHVDLEVSTLRPPTLEVHVFSTGSRHEGHCLEFHVNLGRLWCLTDRNHAFLGVPSKKLLDFVRKHA